MPRRQPNAVIPRAERIQIRAKRSTGSAAPAANRGRRVEPGNGLAGFDLDPANVLAGFA
jgi:hypothetical protein